MPSTLVSLLPPLAICLYLFILNSEPELLSKCKLPHITLINLKGAPFTAKTKVSPGPVPEFLSLDITDI
jgi:hypothetical protein